MEINFPQNLPTPQPSEPTESYRKCKKRRTSSLSSRSDTRKGECELGLLNGEGTTGTGSTPISLSSGISSPALHQVSINMVCTAGQLSNLMSGLAGAGTCVNIKVETPPN